MFQEKNFQVYLHLILTFISMCIILGRKAQMYFTPKENLDVTWTSPLFVFSIWWLLFHCKKHLLIAAHCYSDVGNLLDKQTQ